jgi:hypothetical protein
MVSFSDVMILLDKEPPLLHGTGPKPLQPL